MSMSRSLVDEIKEKSDKIKGDPRAYLLREKRLSTTLHRLAKTHSWWIEHPKLRSDLLRDPPEDRITRVSKMQTGMANLDAAWQYISERADFLNPSTLLTLGTIVEPEHNHGIYRSDRVFLNGLRYIPPNPLKVPEKVEDVFRQTREEPFTPVEKAAYLHLYLAGIQPLNEGNKRTARLFQDRVLVEAHLPPAAIPAGEREAYIDILDAALVDSSEGKKHGPRTFFDYIGGKVNSALDVILHDLQPSYSFRKQ